MPGHTVITKSPLSGGIGESQAEGLWGSELKRAGWDAIVISGRAQTPIYISISDSTVSFKSAEELWGKSVADVHGSIVSDSGDPGTRVAVIGQAGENMVRYASIITDLAFAHNRLGVGAVMGSKNLKAISVRGTMDVCVSDPVSLESLNDFFSKHFSENSVSQATHEFGMGGLATGLCRDGLVASRNYRSSFMPGVEKNIEFGKYPFSQCGETSTVLTVHRHARKIQQPQDYLIHRMPHRSWNCCACSDPTAASRSIQNCWR